MAEPAEFLVFISHSDNVCAKCSKTVLQSAMIAFFKEHPPWCCECAGIDDLVFLPSGDQALTRRAKLHSTRSHVVLKFSRARRRSERQGILVEQAALDLAQKECEADAGTRKERSKTGSVRREKVDREYHAKFAARIRELYPSCPAGREIEIADHACQKYSGRVGRSAMAKELDDEAITLAVRAHIRHRHTNYDRLISTTGDKQYARSQCIAKVDAIEDEWKRFNG